MSFIGSPGKLRRTNIAIVVVIIMVTAVMGFFLSNVIPTQQTLTPTQWKLTIARGVVTIPPFGYQAYLVSIPSRATNITLKGNLTASGDFIDQSIVVLVMDEKAFINWKDRNVMEVYYDSGRLIESSFEVQLPAGGSYYLVLDNTFSKFESKRVDIKAELIYTI